MEPKLLELSQWKQLINADGELPNDYVLRKYTASEETKVLKAEEGGTRQVSFVVSTAAVDHDKDTIKVNGWDLSVYQKNPTVLWAHDSSMLPVAKSIEQTVSRKDLKSVDEFPPEGVNVFADSVYGLIKFGALNAVSVGFKPVEWTYNEDRCGVDFLKQLMLEHSVVPIPSNPEALVTAKSAGVTVDPVVDYIEQTYWELESAVRACGLSKKNLGAILHALEPASVTVPSVPAEPDHGAQIDELRSELADLRQLLEKPEPQSDPEGEDVLEIVESERSASPMTIDAAVLREAIVGMAKPVIEQMMTQSAEDTRREILMATTGRLD